MKVFTLSLLLLLSGCGSLATDKIFNNNLLDTAPQNDTDVLYPDWRLSSEPMKVVTDPVAQVDRRSRVVESQTLSAFLSNNGFDYELLPGEHTIVKLKRPILFHTGSSQLSRSAENWLGVLGRFLAQTANVDIIIEGHTDNTGTERLNDGLSIHRSESVQRVLIDHQVPKKKLYTRGYGEHVPACSNAYTQGRACNRRVEIALIVPERLFQ